MPNQTTKTGKGSRGERERPTLCWTCQNACGGCSWSTRLEPVKGWTAQKTTIRANKTGQERVPTYLVIKCPEHVKDKRENATQPKPTKYDRERMLSMFARGFSRREIAKSFGVDERTIARWKERQRTVEPLEKKRA